MCRLNPRIDFVFKKLFGSEENKEILISFINAVVSEKNQVKDIELKNPYNEKTFHTDKQSILDIKAQDEKGKWYNIEMQIIDQDYYDKRAVYYWAKLYTGQLFSGINYDNLKKTISINILNFYCLNEEEYHNTYRILNENSHRALFDDLEIHFVELQKYNKTHEEIITLLDKWAEFLKKADSYPKKQLPDSLAQVATIKKTMNILQNMSLNEEEREVYENKLKWLRDEEMMIKTAERKGFEKGIEKGKEEGIKEGIQKGIQEGIKEGLREVATKMLLQGIDIQIIAATTGLSEGDIEKLA